MVFFICEVCNESLKKNKVDSHRNACWNAWVFYCMDCGQRFEGAAYKEHTTCMSESQKYEGKFFVPKDNKGDVKQQQWLQSAQQRMEAAPGRTLPSHHPATPRPFSSPPALPPALESPMRAPVVVRGEPAAQEVCRLADAV